MSNNKRTRTKFEEKQVDRMVAVGETGSDFARIWIRSDKPGDVLITSNSQEERVTVDDNAADLTQTVVLKGLKPLTKYEYTVVRLSDNELIGKGQFETFPKKPEDTPEKVSIALMSCHQPFNDDNIVSERRMRLLKVLPKILSDHDVKFILLSGDQIYSDIPSDRSLFSKHYTANWHNKKGPSITDWGAQEVREAYQERYRIFFFMQEVQHFYANYPCYPILDDHEIIDDWGAKQIHSEKPYQNVKKGALEAYFDYQGSRVTERVANLPPSFHYSFDYGNVGVFVLDLRSQRKADVMEDTTGIEDIESIGIGDRRGKGKGKVKEKGQLFDSSQLNDFEKFLNNNQDKRVLLIMSSVPVVHLPEWLSDLGLALTGHALDFPDHWSCEANRDDRDQFLKLIYDHQVRNPRQRVILVSGDVHIGCAFAIQWEGRGKQPTLYQFTSSAISNRVKQSKTQWLEVAPGWASKIDCKNGLKAKTFLLEPLDPAQQKQNPFGGLNVGIIEIHKEQDESPVTFKLVGYPEGKTDDYLDFFVSKKL